jgi:hypothetical protein
MLDLDDCENPARCIMHVGQTGAIYKNSTCCSDCRGEYLDRAAQMIETYFLAKNMGLPTDIARVIIALIVQV